MTDINLPLPRTIRIKSNDANPFSLRCEDPATGEKIEGLRIVSLEVPRVTNQTGFIEAHMTLYVDLDIEADPVPAALQAKDAAGRIWNYVLDPREPR